MHNVRIIGDAHGKLTEYRRLAEQAEYSISLGELGFDYRKLITMYQAGFSGSKHIVVPGNHDNYDAASCLNTFLVNPGYGTIGGFAPFQNMKAFYVRGAASIDRDMRVPGLHWWPEEELSQIALGVAIDYYSDVKPDIMITHTCPDELVQGVPLIPSHYQKHQFRTELALQQMFECHQPQLWVFGHFHLTKKFKVNGTTFVALGELATCDVDPDTLSCLIQGKDGFSWGDGGY